MVTEGSNDEKTKKKKKKEGVHTTNGSDKEARI